MYGTLMKPSLGMTKLKKCSQKLLEKACAFHAVNVVVPGSASVPLHLSTADSGVAVQNEAVALHSVAAKTSVS